MYKSIKQNDFLTLCVYLPKDSGCLFNFIQTEPVNVLFSVVSNDFNGAKGEYNIVLSLAENQDIKYFKTNPFKKYVLLARRGTPCGLLMCSPQNNTLTDIAFECHKPIKIV